METKNNPAEKKRTGKTTSKLTPGLIIGVVVSFFVLAYLGSTAWALLVIVLAVIHYIRSVKDKRRLPQEETPEAKECELCGIRTENLIPVRLSGRNALVCEECFKANRFHGTEEADTTARDESEEAETPGEPARLISETDQEREDRLARLAAKRGKDSPLREELFLEDIEDENSIRGICAMWESYGFGNEYPGIDASLARLREKESGLWFSARAVSRLKEELKDLFPGKEAATAADTE